MQFAFSFMYFICVYPGCKTLLPNVIESRYRPKGCRFNQSEPAHGLWPGYASCVIKYLLCTIHTCTIANKMCRWSTHVWQASHVYKDYVHFYWKWNTWALNLKPCRILTLIWVIPASRMVSVEQVKYLKARSRPSLSNETCVSIGSLTAAHIRSVMFLVPARRRSRSDSRHM